MVTVRPLAEEIPHSPNTLEASGVVERRHASLQTARASGTTGEVISGKLLRDRRGAKSACLDAGVDPSNRKVGCYIRNK